MRSAPVPEIDCVTAIYEPAATSGPRAHPSPPARAANTYAVLLERGALRAVRELRRGRSELGQARNGEVLLVRVRLGEDLLRLLDGVQDIRLAVVVAVRADTEVNLARVLVRLERLGNAWGWEAMEGSSA